MSSRTLAQKASSLSGCLSPSVGSPFTEVSARILLYRLAAAATLPDGTKHGMRIEGNESCTTRNVGAIDVHQETFHLEGAVGLSRSSPCPFQERGRKMDVDSQLNHEESIRRLNRSWKMVGGHLAPCNEVRQILWKPDDIGIPSRPSGYVVEDIRADSVKRKRKKKMNKHKQRKRRRLNRHKNT